MGGSIYWTADEQEQVRELAAQGLKAAEISERMGGRRGINSVVNYCRAHGISILDRSPNQFWTPEETATAKAMFAEMDGKMRRKDIYRYIGEKLGRGYRGVQNVIIGRTQGCYSEIKGKNGCIVRPTGAPPPEVLRERDEALSHTPTLTAALFGDPPPSRSALAQMGV